MGNNKFKGLADKDNCACKKCAYAVYSDNPHCGLRGFTSSFYHEFCSAQDDKAPSGYELQEDGYFSWVDKNIDKSVDSTMLNNIVKEGLETEGYFHVPDGYELKDENGNVINATKIVLEKKEKRISEDL